MSIAKKPNHVDQHVGKRVRLCRALHDLSQDELAQMLNVTGQQVQKYEAGETRVSAARLFEIAQRLAVPINWFFEELGESPANLPPREPSDGAPHDDKMDLGRIMARREAREIVEAYFNIPDERMRKKLLQMAFLLSKGAEP